jgi:hypothetical protein
MADFSTRAFNSFSGADIKAVFGNKEVGNLMAVSYAIQREKAPIYVLGEANPRAFSRGKRGIAGSLIFIQFDTHAILEQFDGDKAGTLGMFIKKKHEVDPSDLREQTGPAQRTGEMLSNNGDDPTQMGELAKAFYADQLPPFDVTVAALNELGVAANCVIHNVELMNEGWGMGIEDRQADMQTTYLARAVTRWRTQGTPNITKEGGNVIVGQPTAGGASTPIIA